MTPIAYIALGVAIGVVGTLIVLTLAAVAMVRAEQPPADERPPFLGANAWRGR